MSFMAALYDGKLGYTAMQDRQILASLSQAGVLRSNDCKVTSGSGLASNIAAGIAAVPNTFQATYGGLYLCQNTATVAATHAVGDPTNPRIDQVCVKVYDSDTGGDVSDITQAIVIPGTPTEGATINNRLGATPALPPNSLRLADVLVPPSAGASTFFTYRDRRAWMQGAKSLRESSISYETTSETTTELGFSAFRTRLEIGAGKLGFVQFSGVLALSGAESFINAKIFLVIGENVVEEPNLTNSFALPASSVIPFSLSAFFVGSGESLLFRPFWKIDTSIGTPKMKFEAGGRLAIMEFVTGNALNGTS